MHGGMYVVGDHFHRQHVGRDNDLYMYQLLHATDR